MENFIRKISQLSVPVLQKLIETRKPILISLAITLCLFYTKSYLNRPNNQAHRIPFWSKTFKYFRIAVPSFSSPEFFHITILTFLLITRSLLSVSISAVNGKIVKSILDRNSKSFLRKILNLGLYSMPSSLINSSIDYFNLKLNIRFRKNLSDYFNKKYFSGLVFYQANRELPNCEERITEDIARWAAGFSSIYSNIGKPLLDITLFSLKMSEVIGKRGPAIVFVCYFLAGFFMRLVQNSFRRILSDEQRQEILYRELQSSVESHAEEIAFYCGSHWENLRLKKSLKRLVYLSIKAFKAQFCIGILDEITVKYGIACLAYGIMGIPVFGPNSREYLEKIKHKKTFIARDYIKNSSLLINLSKAISRLEATYKDLPKLVKCTARVSELDEILDKLQTEDNHLERDQYSVSNKISFKKVPILTPLGDYLVSEFSLEIPRGCHTLIEGPNGCGKSTLLKILAGLQPTHKGFIEKPESVLYVPQNFYLFEGCYVDQMIYPDSRKDMAEKGMTDENLYEILAVVGVRVDLYRAENWMMRLTNDGKARSTFARILYHECDYVLIDEFPNTLAEEVEDRIFNYMKAEGSTIIAVSHKKSMKKHFEMVLSFDGSSGYTFSSN